MFSRKFTAFNKTLLYFFVFFLFSVEVVADGCLLASPGTELWEPEQKAILLWDGETETLILSAKIKTKELTKIAWIIPIGSDTEPNVEAASIDVFYDVTDYVWKETYRRNWFEELTRFGTFAGGGTQDVDVVSISKVDIYDVTVLRAKNAGDLIEWLNVNGYYISDQYKPILTEYADGKTYFIVNKINIENEYGEDLERFRRKLGTDSMTNSQLLDLAGSMSGEWYKLMERRHIGGSNYKYEPKEITADILTKRTYSSSRANSTIGNLLLSRTDYEMLVDKYGHDFSHLVTKNLNYLRVREGESKEVVESKRVLGNIRCTYRCYSQKERKRYLIHDGSSGCTHSVQCDSLVDGEDLTIKEYITRVRDEMDVIKSKYEKIVEYIDSHSDKQAIGDIRNLSRLKSKIESGFGTPLKITFKPDKPTYPLKVSSINRGPSTVNLYVVSKNKPMTDENNMLNFTSAFLVHDPLRQKIKEQTDFQNPEYLTILQFKGYSSEFVDDAVLSYCEDCPITNPPDYSWIFILAVLLLLIFGLASLLYFLQKLLKKD